MSVCVCVGGINHHILQRNGQRCKMKADANTNRAPPTQIHQKNHEFAVVSVTLTVSTAVCVCVYVCACERKKREKETEILYIAWK